MEYPEMFNWLCTQEGVHGEWPSLCGTSNIGSRNCKGHGHLSLSVAVETVQDISFSSSHKALLVSVPISVFNELKEKAKT